MSLPWLRLYAEFASDPDVQSLAFEDQRHYVVLLCLKASGTLDKAYPTLERRMAVISRGLGLDQNTAREAQRRLMEAGLIDEQWQPLGWNERQYQADTSAARTRRWREKRFGDVTVTSPRTSRNVTVTAPDTDSDTDTEKKNLQQAEPLVRLADSGDPPPPGSAEGLPGLRLTNGREAFLTAPWAAKLGELHPALDLPGQVRSMAAWLIANPSRRKTPSGISRFVVGWLGKEQNRARGPGNTQAQQFRQAADEEYLEQLTRRRGDVA